MIGLGHCPLGTSALGFGAFASSSARAQLAPTDEQLAPQLDPATGEFSFENGSLAMSHGLQQRVVIALRTRFGSSVLRWLGSRLHEIDRISDNHEKRVESAVHAALRHLTEPGLVRLLSVRVQRHAPSLSLVHVLWCDPARPHSAPVETVLP